MIYPRDPTAHYDVYFSRGRAENDFPGNTTYRSKSPIYLLFLIFRHFQNHCITHIFFALDLINENCEAFNSTECKDTTKKTIKNHIVATLEKLGAKFYGDLTHDFQWRELGRDEVVKKVAQALNDKKKVKSQHRHGTNPNKERR